MSNGYTRYPANGGITSINGDTTAAQIISAGVGISVSTVGGNTTITNTSPAAATGNLTDAGTDGIVITGGTNAVNGAGTSIAQHVADSTHNGYLSSTDWTTFNNKQSALTLGDLTDAGTDGITVTGGTGAVVGSGTSLSQHVADSTHNGYLSSTDWSTFNNKQPAGGYVVGPGSSTDNAITRFDGTTGLLVQNSVVIIDDSGNASGFGTIASGKITATNADRGLLVNSTTLSADNSFMRVQGSMPAASTTDKYGASVVVTTAGATTDAKQNGLFVSIGATYSGNGLSKAIEIDQSISGTGGDFSSNRGNYGLYSECQGVNTGINISGFLRGQGATVNVGVKAAGESSTNSTKAIGVLGTAFNSGTSPIRIGGYFALFSTGAYSVAADYPSTSVALACTNGSQTDDIFQAMDNTSVVFKIADGGQVTLTGNLKTNVTASRIVATDASNILVAATTGDLTDAGTDGIVVTGGTGAVLGSGTSLAQHVADSTHNGYLSSTDWSTFNSKQASGNYITALTGDVTATGPGSVAASISSATVTGKLLTGFVSGAGTVAATDTILQGFNKLDGNVALKAPLASPTFTGTVTLPSGSITSSAWSAGSSTFTTTGRAYFGDGTTALSGISFASDTDSGFSNAGGNEIHVNIGATEVWRWDSTGAAQLTSTNAVPFQIFGSSASQTDIYLVNTASSGQTWAIKNLGNSQGASIADMDFQNQTSLKTNLKLRQMGDVGIGDNNNTVSQNAQLFVVVVPDANITGTTTASATTVVNVTSGRCTANLGAGDEVSLNGGTNFATVTSITNATQFVTDVNVGAGGTQNILRRRMPFTIWDRNGVQVLKLTPTNSTFCLSPPAERALLVTGTSTMATDNSWMRVTGTMPSALTSDRYGASVTVTTAGSTTDSKQNGLLLNLGSTYSGNGLTKGLEISNNSSGTGGDFSSNRGNYGIYTECQGTTTGINTGAFIRGQNADVSVGAKIAGEAFSTSQKAIGVLGLAFNSGSSPVRIAGFFALNTSSAYSVAADYPSTSVALACTNDGKTDDIFQAMDGSTVAFRVADGGDVTAETGNFKITTAGKGLYIKEGSNATSGVATLVLGTVVVSTTAVTANSRIQLTAQSLGTITAPVGLAVSARTAGTSFTILSGNLTDTSPVAWVIVEPA